MFRASLRPSSGGQTVLSLPVVFCPVKGNLYKVLRYTLYIDFLLQGRKRYAVKTQSDLLTMGVKMPETC